MPAKLILPGRISESNMAFDSDVSNFLTVEIKRTQIVDALARGVAQQEQVLNDVEETDIIEREWQNGIKQWVSVAQLREDVRQDRTSRGLDTDELRVPVAPPLRLANRGLSEWALKALKILRISPAEETAKWSVKKIIGHFEGQLRPEAGLYRIQGSMQLEEQKLTARDLTDKAPYLVFIHGTASTTTGSFGKLANTVELKALQNLYDARILAFQHRTLSQSPIENALELAKALPKNAELHIVSHSRGGLIGELLCLRPLTKEDEELFRIGRREDEIEMLRELSGELTSKNFRIGKFVRIACPARGTILASKRLDLYFSVILNVLGLIPALHASPVYSFIKATLLELAKRRTRPEEVPGLEAQMPESALIHLLNRPAITTKADLAVIAGDIEGSGVWGSLKIFASDLFYQEDHDLVVNTKAMYGGMNREQGAYYYFDHGPDVNHFNYFENTRTRQKMLSWLVQTDGQAKDDGFSLISRRAANLTVKRSRSATKDLPSVFVVPCSMGSHLKDGKERIWVDFESLAMGGIERLAISNQKVVPDGLVGAAYQNIVSFLQDSNKVITFPYDWRLSVYESGSLLANKVKAELNQHDRPVRILAHSMGGLVAWAMIVQNPDLWQEVRKRDGRLLMLGTPRHGSFAILRMLFGKEKILRQLALLDPKHRLNGVIDILRQFPGLLEMLPEGNDGVDYFDPAWWRSIPSVLTTPGDLALKIARETRRNLLNEGLPSNVVYVAGSAPITPSSIRVSSNGDISFDVTSDGDGRVVHDPRLRTDVPTWYMNAPHGDLVNYPPAFQALLELLNTGKTNKLSDSPVMSRRQEVVLTQPVPDDAPILFPTEEDLIDSAIGSEPVQVQTEQPHTLRVSVAYGDLARAKYPVAVGHYLGDTVVNAEKRLDKMLEGRLSELFRLELYPGQQGTTEVIFAPNAKPKGAMIIGLGEVGSITPETVRRGILNVALRYALMVANETRDMADQGDSPASPKGTTQGDQTSQVFGQSWRSAAFSSLLIGTYGGNALSVETSLNAIMQGTLQANQALRSQGLWDRVRIDEVEIVELYEDVALEATRALSDLEQNPPLDLISNQRIQLDPPYVHSLGGGRFQRPANQYSTGWWRRIKIEGDRDEKTGDLTGNLKYLALTDRARAEATLQATQVALINQYIEKAIESTGYDHKLGATLFELLVPNELKSQINVEADLVLVVDSDAAQYPWELLSEPAREQPLALYMGLIRQFITAGYKAIPQPIREKAALVIGSANVKGMPGEIYPDLPGARKEAIAVAAILNNAGYDTGEVLIDADGPTVVRELVTRRYKILHLAGHGVYNEGDEKTSGMVLGDGIYLSTAEISSLGPIPELAFINCCHLARIDDQPILFNRSPHKLAASIAQELINKGVKAVVAAGWAVNDDAASAFAREFYTKMFNGQTFGQAVLQARKAAREASNDSNTWGAYQCYGNPGFVLEQVADSKKEPRRNRLFSRREYLDALSNIKEDAESATPEETEALRAQVAELYRSLPAHWRDGGTLGAFGATWASLDNFDKAIDIYQEALSQEKAEAPISTIEQLANLLSRYALALRESEEESEARGSKAGISSLEHTLPQLTQKAAFLLDWILKLGGTSERLSIYGGHYKRLAAASEGDERKNMLEKAESYYGEAHEENLRQKKLDFYPTLNWITCRVLLGRRLNKKPVLELISDCKKAAKKKERSEPSIWNRIAEPDADLLSHLIQKDLAANKASVISTYQKVLKTGAKPKDISSIKGQMYILIRILGSADSKTAPETVQALRDILAAIGK